MNKLIFGFLAAVSVSSCGGDGIPITVETPSLDNLASTITEVSGLSTNDGSTVTNEVSAPSLVARPEIVENYQYKCTSNENPDRTWVWTLRPELDIADQYGAITGRWDWIDNLTLLIKPTGNDQVIGSLDEFTGIIFLENWGRCSSDSEIQIAEQFTRPD